MFEIKFEINGRRIDPKNISDVLEKATLEVIEKHITKSVGSVRCPEHGSGAKIVAKGRDISNLSFTVAGCCQKLIDEVNKKLK